MMAKTLYKYLKKGCVLGKPGRSCKQPSNKCYDMFQNPRQAYLCLSDKDLQDMAAIKYTTDR
jgi:hypothetical protein